MISFSRFVLRFMIALLLVVTTAIGGQAWAYTLTSFGVDNGCALTYSDTNKVAIGGGSLFISGTQYDMAQTTIDLTGSANTWAWDSCVTALGANTIYYVYDMVTANQSAREVVITPYIGPSSNGEPSNNITWTDSSSNSQTSGYGVFLGSFTTDNSKNVIPFERFGDDVILSPPVNGITAFSKFFNNKVSMDPAAGVLTIDSSAAGTRHLDFGTPGYTDLLWLPLSASAMIVDVTALNHSSTCGTDTSGNNVLYFLNPKLVNATAQYPQAAVAVSCASASSRVATFSRLRLQTVQDTSHFTQPTTCTWDHSTDYYESQVWMYVQAANIWVGLAYRGYVEHIQQLTLESQ